MNDIKTYIRIKLDEIGLSIHGLEKRASLRRGTIQNILSGKSKNPGIYTVRAIARALGCPISSLIGEDLNKYADLKFHISAASRRSITGIFSSDRPASVNQSQQSCGELNPNEVKDFLCSSYSSYTSFDVEKLKLSVREEQCLMYLSEGQTAKEIAKNIDISFRTVESYLLKIKLKTGFHRKSELVKFYKNIKKK